MLKVLLKKQFLELKSSYFKNKRTGKQITKTKMFGFSILLFLLYISCCMGFVGMGHLFISTLKPLNLLWLYFSLFALTMIVAGTFITMFFSMSILYNAKDNDLLLSLPIKSKDIVLSRMIVLYFNTLIFTGVVWPPITVLYFILVGFNLKLLIINIILWLSLSLIVLVLASLFGYIVANISKLFKGKKYITTIITSIFLVLYYVFYFQINKYLNQVVNHILEVEIFFKENLSILYLIGKAGNGDIKNLILVVIISVLLTFISICLINKNFTSIIKNKGLSVKSKNKDLKIKQNSVKEALIKKELKHYLSSTTYTLNCGLGVLLFIGGSIYILFAKDKLLTYIASFEMAMPIKEMLPAFILAIVAGITSMDMLACPAVSLEGNTYWLTRSLPIKTYDILMAKRELQFRINVISTIIFLVVITSMLEITGTVQVLLILSAIVFNSFISLFDLFIGIKWANLNWTSEVVPIKQSFSTLFCVLLSFVIVPLIAGVYYFLQETITMEFYLISIIVISVILVKILDNWVKNKGVKLYENL